MSFLAVAGDDGGKAVVDQLQGRDATQPAVAAQQALAVVFGEFADDLGTDARHGEDFLLGPGKALAVGCHQAFHHTLDLYREIGKRAFIEAFDDVSATSFDQRGADAILAQAEALGIQLAAKQAEQGGLDAAVALDLRCGQRPADLAIDA
ncbi:MAG: hypothetical protein MUF31_04700 [Akkermansiaceae bacterium]|nr:hypothetical protein [Akkermansiaceae bacterium]